MAYVVGQDDKKKGDQMNVLGQPQSFQNIKAQLQQQQVQQPVQSQFQQPAQQAPQEPQVKKKKQKQRYADGDIVEDEENLSLTGGQASTISSKPSPQQSYDGIKQQLLAAGMGPVEQLGSTPPTSDRTYRVGPVQPPSKGPIDPPRVGINPPPGFGDFRPPYRPQPIKPYPIDGVNPPSKYPGGWGDKPVFGYTPIDGRFDFDKWKEENPGGFRDRPIHQPYQPKQHFEDGGIGEEEEDYSLTGGASGTIGSGYTGRGAGSTAPQQRSGSFTGISDYIEANKPKTQQMAQGITEGITGAAGKLLGGAKQTGQEFAGQTSGAEKYIDETIGAAGTGQEVTQAPVQTTPTGTGGKQPGMTGTMGGGMDKQPLPDEPYTPILSGGPAEQPSTPSKYGWEDYYGGLKTPTGGQQQQYEAGQLQSRAQNLAKSGGRFAELQRLVGKQSPNYTAGQRRLDQLLLAGDPQSRIESIRQTRAATQGLQGDIGNIYGGMAGRAGELQERARTGVAGAQEQSAADIEARRAAKQAEVDEIRKSFGSEGDYALSQEQLNNLGIDAGNLYGYDVNKAITENLYDATAQNVMTPEQVARVNALSKLTGKGDVYDPSGEYGGFGMGNFGTDVSAGIAAAKAKWDPKGKQLESLTQQKPLYDQLGSLNAQLEEVQERMRLTRNPSDADYRLRDQLQSQIGGVGSQITQLQDPSSSAQGLNFYKNAFDQGSYDKLLAEQKGFRNIGVQE